ncbi:hypothetical protein PQX77_011386 [Marasmius sp. AFHP31]|nr:hypothetical protein PQX77_011386 [Marasmius sp. AFHP31]
MPSHAPSMPGSPSSRSKSRSPPSTFSRTVTKTSIRRVEKSGASKVTTCTTSRTTTVVVREGSVPSDNQTSSTSAPQPPDDSDNPDDDATIEFATDSDSDFLPSSHISSRVHLGGSVPASSQSSPHLSSRSIPSKSEPQTSDTNSDCLVAAYYEERYPGRVPQPRDLKEPEPRSPIYYVVTSGRSVGIFTDWNLVSNLVMGVSKASFHKHKQFVKAWVAYRYSWASMRVHVLQAHQDCAPLHTQLTDSGLEFSLGNITL